MDILKIKMVKRSGNEISYKLTIIPLCFSTKRNIYKLKS